MPYGISFFPNSQIVDEEDYTHLPEESTLNALDKGINYGIKSATTSQLITAARAKFYETFDSEHLTKDDWQKSEYYRSGLNFPNGLSKKHAAFAAKIYDDKVSNDYKLQSLLHNNKGAFVTGTIIGTLLDPIDLGVIAATEGASSVLKVGKTINDIAKTNKILKTVYKAGYGAIEGATISLQYATANAASEHELGEDLSMREFSDSVITGSLLGVTARTALGFKKANTVTENIDALNTATKQLMLGKSPNVTPIIKNAIYQDELKDINNNLFHEDNILKANNLDGVTPDELNNTVHEINSYKSDLSFSSDNNLLPDKFNHENNTLDEHDTYLNNKINDLTKNNKFNTEDTELLQKANSFNDNFTKIKKALVDTTNCILEYGF